MFIDVEAFFLNALVDTQANGLLNAVEENETASSSPKVDNDNTENLSQEESGAMTVEPALTYREQSRQDGTEDTANAVDGACTNGVVDMKFLVNKFNGEHKYGTANGTNDNSTDRRNHVATGRDTYQTGQDAVKRK